MATFQLHGLTWDTADFRSDYGLVQPVTVDGIAMDRWVALHYAGAAAVAAAAEGIGAAEALAPIVDDVVALAGAPDDITALAALEDATGALSALGPVAVQIGALGPVAADIAACADALADIQAAPAAATAAAAQASAAGTSATAASGHATAATSARTAAETARDAALGHAATAGGHATAATTARTAAEAARDTAEGHATSAAGSATAAAAGATAADDSATSAGDSATAAAGSATAAAGSATTAGGHATTAASARTAAEGARDTAQGHAATATAARTGAEAARDLSQAWADSEAQEPGGPGTKSAREWAAEAQAIAGGDFAPASHGHDAAAIVSGTLDIARLPAAALERLVDVADQAARYALTTATVQVGDTVRQLDTGILYRVVDTDHLDGATGYVEYTAGQAAAVPWSGVTDRPSTYPPTAHTHPSTAISDASAAGRAMLTAADTAAQRTALALGSAATANVGTTAGSVAAGDDSRIVGALPRAGGTMTGAIDFDGAGAVDVGAANNTIAVQSYAATLAPAYTATNHVSVTVTGDIIEVDAPTGTAAGQVVVLELTQDGTGGHSITAWDAWWDFGDQDAPDLPTGAGETLVVSAIVSTGGASGRTTQVWRTS
ncbi:hypothetical protein [Roseospira goensis]|uniref:Uncharacterized protein n=1 Tax=Roseospira goensis TaxID=391922 RepID=A0A7W6WLX2_9PROT|nr:hypothetical protein [Roseospira goensis]MBB4287520.1 hypothetical protein [Roseospira goensis]